MKEGIKGFVIGCIVTAMVGTGAAWAASNLVTIEVAPNNVNFEINGVAMDIPSFTYNDSTYVQLRPVLENMDCSVGYNAATKTVIAQNDLDRLKQYTWIATLEDISVRFFTEGVTDETMDAFCVWHTNATYNELDDKTREEVAALLSGAFESVSPLIDEINEIIESEGTGVYNYDEWLPIICNQFMDYIISNR